MTTCNNADDVLPLKFGSPAKTAVIECVATDNDEVLIVAWPETLSVPVPSVVEPSLKVTLPVGVPAPGDVTVTVAVNVTDWPNTEGFADEATAVVVEA